MRSALTCLHPTQTLRYHSMSSGTSGVDKRGGILPAIETSLEIARASVAGLGIIGLEAAIGGVLSVVTALKVCPLPGTCPRQTNLKL